MYWQVLAPHFPNANIGQVAIGGNTMAQMVTQGATEIDPKLGASPNVVTLLAGINDIFAGDDAGTIYTNMTQWITDRKAAGWDCVVVATYWKVGVYTNTTAMEPERVSLNNLIRANAADATCIVDLEALPEFADPNDLNYSRFENFQGLHKHTHGQAVIANAMRDSIENCCLGK